MQSGKEEEQKQPMANNGGQGAVSPSRQPPDTQAGPARQPPPICDCGPRASMPQVPHNRATASLNRIRDFSATPVKLDWSSLLRVSPNLRQDARPFLHECDSQPGPSGPFLQRSTPEQPIPWGLQGHPRSHNKVLYPWRQCLTLSV